MTWIIITFLPILITFNSGNFISHIISSLPLFVIDNGNLPFLLLVFTLAPLICMVAGFETKRWNVNILLIGLNILMLLAFLSTYLISLFVIYETMVITLLILCYVMLISYYRIRACFYLFIYSIFGSIAFILSICFFSINATTASILIILPFIIKLPCFPFYYWLPEVHAEANTSISLFLAGLVLKLSLFGLIRFVLSSFYIALRFWAPFVFVLVAVSMLSVTSSMFRYYDLKKVIALSSIMHLNFTFVSLFSCNSIAITGAILLAIAHGFSSVGLFLFVGYLTTITSSRSIDSITWLSGGMRIILGLLLLANLSFPTTLNFIAELYALAGLISISFVWTALFFFAMFISTYYWLILFNKKSGFLHQYSFTSLQTSYLYYLIMLLFVPGIYALIFL